MYVCPFVSIGFFLYVRSYSSQFWRAVYGETEDEDLVIHKQTFSAVSTRFTSIDFHLINMAISMKWRFPTWLCPWSLENLHWLNSSGIYCRRKMKVCEISICFVSIFAMKMKRSSYICNLALACGSTVVHPTVFAKSMKPVRQAILYYFI